MQYTKVSVQTITDLKKIVGDQFVSTGNEDLEKYGQDETEDLVYLPEVVVKPANALEIAQILKYCNKHLIPLTPRAAGTGLSGAALPIYGGILLSIERLNKIIEIDERNLQATVEPGVINEVFQKTVQEKGLFYPPDPASKGSCFLGGNVAMSAGGPRALKYGVTKEYVLNLEVVLPSGDIIWTGANVLKNSTGFNLTQLMVGSEGMLGIITKIVFKLIPYPSKNIVLLAPFFSAEKACEAVSAIFRAGITPSALEFLERDAIDWALKNLSDISITIKDNIQAHLLIELDGNDLDVIMRDAEKVSEVLMQYECDEILLADTEEQKNNLWKIRRKVPESVKSQSIYKEEDTVVPRAELPILLKGVKEIGKKYGFKSVCYGHAGDGNLHVNILKGDMSDNAWNNELPKGIREIFELCVQLKGTLSGEHGIGLVQKPYMDIAFTPVAIELQKGIKKLFDPNTILNPGKMF